MISEGRIRNFSSLYINTIGLSSMLVTHISYQSHEMHTNYGLCRPRALHSQILFIDTAYMYMISYTHVYGIQGCEQSGTRYGDKSKLYISETVGVTD